MTHVPALAYARIGWSVVRLHPCSKRPIGDAWQNGHDPAAFDPTDNVGVVLGAPSGGLVDVDLDNAHAQVLAPLHLPPTATFGRGGVRAHYLYRCATTTWRPRGVGVELRSTGCQTMFPGSLHPSGEPVAWIDAGSPVSIDEGALGAAVGSLVAAVALALAWPEVQQRRDAHHTVLAIAGALWHAGWTEQAARRLLLPALALAGPDPGHREQAIVDTWGEHDRHRYGWPTVRELVGDTLGRTLELAIARVPTTPRVVAAEVAAGASAFPLTEAGTAERYLHDHGDGVRFVSDLGWFVWDGIRWDTARSPIRGALALVRTIAAEGLALGDAERVTWGRSCESRARINAIVDLAECLDTRTGSTDLDRDPMLFACANGVIDLRTGTLREARPADLMTRCSPVRFDPNAQCPRFARFLAEVFPHPDLVAYVLRFLGYAITGRIDEHVLGIWYGTGSNGKSTLIEILRFVLGDYAQKLPSGLLTQAKSRDGNSASPGVVRLLGARFAAGSETSETSRWDEELTKELTGGDTIAGRALYRGLVEIRPTWKIVIGCNHKPKVRGGDHGIWRRLHVVPFTTRFDGATKELGLYDYLEKHEAEGILALLVRACLEWQRMGLAPPERVLTENANYKRAQDVVGAFLTECVDHVHGAATPASAMYRAFRAWAIEGGEYVHGRTAFARILDERGYQLHERRWIDVKMKPG